MATMKCIDHSQSQSVSSVQRTNAILYVIAAALLMDLAMRVYDLVKDAL